MDRDVMILTGAGQIGMAIARRMGYGKKIVLGDRKKENAETIARIMNEAGFDVVPAEMDLASRDSVRDLIAAARRYGDIGMLVNAASVSPSQASVETILKVDLYGTAVLLEEVGKVIAEGGTGVTISSQSGHRMPALSPQEDEQLACTDTEALLELEILASVKPILILHPSGAAENVKNLSLPQVKNLAGGFGSCSEEPRALCLRGSTSERFGTTMFCGL